MKPLKKSNVITKYKYTFFTDETIIRYFEYLVNLFGNLDGEALEVEKEIERRNNEDLGQGRTPRFKKEPTQINNT